MTPDAPAEGSERPRCLIVDGEEPAHCRHYVKGGYCCHCGGCPDLVQNLIDSLPDEGSERGTEPGDKVSEKLRIARAALLVGAQWLNEAEREWRAQSERPDLNPAQAGWERRQ